MFTGIIAATGTLASITDTGSDWRIRVQSEQLDFSDVATGDSIAVSGVCLTALAITKYGFDADVSRETLACTTMQELRSGDLVNLEKALTPQSRLCERFTGKEARVFRVPPALARYIAHKGSVCLDGVSLTVNEVSGNTFGVNIIPHTAERTTLQQCQPGQKVNVEVDVISRYLERLLEGKAETATGLTLDKLAKAGFAGK